MKTFTLNPRLEPGFSLVELLTVLGIVLVLAALLATGITSSQRSARNIVCVGNLRQLAVAAHLYWQDNDGWTFPYKKSDAEIADGDVYWFGWLGRGPEGTRRFDRAAGALYPYLQEAKVGICPAFNYRSPHLKLKATGAAYGYGYNLQLGNPGHPRTIRVDQIKGLSALAIFADAAQVNTFQPPASAAHPMLEEFYYIVANEPTVHFRHKRKANVAFGDGHISGASPLAGSLDERIRGEMVGRLPASILEVK